MSSYFEVGDIVEVVLTAGQNLPTNIGRVVKVVTDRRESLPPHVVVKFDTGVAKPFPDYALRFVRKSEQEEHVESLTERRERRWKEFQQEG